MKLAGRTLAVVAAALVVVGFWLVIGALSASSGAVGAIGGMGGGHMQGGFNLAGIADLFPTLAIVAIVTAIVAPLKQRLISTRRPSTPARRPQAAAPAA
jgi:hypothetical protein